jgi:membrane protein DedA with SNARE-associated domain
MAFKWRSRFRGWSESRTDRKLIPMRLMLVLATLLIAAGEFDRVEDWMQQACYPALLVILVVASLGVPIPEDIPLIVAGVLLRTHPNIASPHGTFIVALVGIMSGDLVLYSLGRRWGPEVVNHRSVRWMITPERFTRVARRFRVHGTWFCFFGRFLVGVRAVMCLTAGATGFPYWRFFLADFAGALLSIPLFISLGYWFAGMIPTLEAYLSRAEALAWAAAIVAVVVLTLVYRARRRRRPRRRATAGHVATPSAVEVPEPPSGRPGPTLKAGLASAKSDVTGDAA